MPPENDQQEAVRITLSREERQELAVAALIKHPARNYRAATWLMAQTGVCRRTADRWLKEARKDLCGESNQGLSLTRATLVHRLLSILDETERRGDFRNSLRAIEILRQVTGNLPPDESLRLPYKGIEYYIVDPVEGTTKQLTGPQWVAPGPDDGSADEGTGELQLESR